MKELSKPKPAALTEKVTNPWREHSSLRLLTSVNVQHDTNRRHDLGPLKQDDQQTICWWNLWVPEIKSSSHEGHPIPWRSHHQKMLNIIITSNQQWERLFSVRSFIHLRLSVCLGKERIHPGWDTNPTQAQVKVMILVTGRKPQNPPHHTSLETHTDLGVTCEPLYIQ